MSNIGDERVHSLFLRVSAGESETLQLESWRTGVHVRQKLNNFRKALRGELAAATASVAAEDGRYTEAQRLRLNALSAAAENCVFRLVPAKAEGATRDAPAVVLCEPAYNAGDPLSAALRAAEARREAAKPPQAPEPEPERRDADDVLAELGFVRKAPPAD